MKPVCQCDAVSVMPFPNTRRHDAPAAPDLSLAVRRDAEAMPNLALLLVRHEVRLCIHGGAVAPRALEDAQDPYVDDRAIPLTRCQLFVRIQHDEDRRRRNRRGVLALRSNSLAGRRDELLDAKRELRRREVRLARCTQELIPERRCSLVRESVAEHARVKLRRLLLLLCLLLRADRLPTHGQRQAKQSPLPKEGFAIREAGQVGRIGITSIRRRRRRTRR
mmetsp:Transcript_857/g.3138  ORF Transcript_857/g.3138 Transcript_857/m.3138 type:complete len:221 (-) Transcript_857:1390-2052(-)